MRPTALQLTTRSLKTPQNVLPHNSNTNSTKI